MAPLAITSSPEATLDNIGPKDESPQDRLDALRADEALLSGLPRERTPLPPDLIKLLRIERGLSETARARRAGQPLLPGNPWSRALEDWFAASAVRTLHSWRRWRPLVRGILWQIAGALQHLVRRRLPQPQADLAPVFVAAGGAVHDDDDSIVLASFEERLSAGRVARRLRHETGEDTSPAMRPDWRRYHAMLKKAQPADRRYYVETRRYLVRHSDASLSEAYQVVADRFGVSWKRVQAARSRIAALAVE